jgi:hypothetical protein
VLTRVGRVRAAQQALQDEWDAAGAHQHTAATFASWLDARLDAAVSQELEFDTDARVLLSIKPVPLPRLLAAAQRACTGAVAAFFEEKAREQAAREAAARQEAAARENKRKFFALYGGGEAAGDGDVSAGGAGPSAQPAPQAEARGGANHAHAADGAGCAHRHMHALVVEGPCIVSAACACSRTYRRRAALRAQARRLSVRAAGCPACRGAPCFGPGCDQRPDRGRRGS